MIPALRLRAAHQIPLALGVQQVGRHENDQDGIHPVIAEPLRRLISDNVPHAWRHFVRLERRGKVFSFGHEPLRIFQILQPEASRKTGPGEPSKDFAGRGEIRFAGVSPKDVANSALAAYHALVRASGRAAASHG